jgi:hypothetical protein
MKRGCSASVCTLMPLARFGSVRTRSPKHRSHGSNEQARSMRSIARAPIARTHGRGCPLREWQDGLRASSRRRSPELARVLELAAAQEEEVHRRLRGDKARRRDWEEMRRLRTRGDRSVGRAFRRTRPLGRLDRDGECFGSLKHSGHLARIDLRAAPGKFGSMRSRLMLPFFWITRLARTGAPALALRTQPAEHWPR